jgi:hypothetical protein
MLGLVGALEAAGLLQAGRRRGRGGGAAGGRTSPRGEARDLPVHERRPVARRHLRPEAGAATHEARSRRARAGRDTKGGTLMPSPFAFRPHGESGLVLSELFPELAKCADDLCVIRSMHTDVPNHEPGLLLMQSGHQQPTRPCLGSWASYGLGSENRNLPAFVVLCPGLPVVGPQLWSNAFLPGEHQGMAVDTNSLQVDRMVSNLRHPRLDRAGQRRQLDLLETLNRRHLDDRAHDAALETQIKALEMAYQMQAEASEAFDLGREPESIREMYGRSTFGQSCLLARRWPSAACGSPRSTTCPRRTSSPGTPTRTITSATASCAPTATAPRPPC